MGADVVVRTAADRGLPPLRAYLGEAWRRRAFAWYLARRRLRAEHLDTLLGQLWVVVNPLLLAGVYWMLVAILAGRDRVSFTHLVFGLFLFNATRYSATLGARSVTDASALVLNTTFPRALLPAASVIAATETLLPTLLVYAVIHTIAGQPVTVALLAIPGLLVLQTVFNLGLTLLLGAATVEVRDTTTLLPYLLRIWLYLTPVLYTAEQVPERLRPYLRANPLFALFDAYGDTLVGRWPGASAWWTAGAWAFGVLVAGGWWFLVRERSFGVRL